MKINRSKFWILECKEAPGNYYQDDKIICTPNVLDAKKFKNIKEALKNNPNKDFKVRKVTIIVH